MQKIILLALIMLSVGKVKAQQTDGKVSRKIDISSRPGDHLMFQLSSDHWTGMPDSISSHQSGFSKGFNAYVMLDKPFRSSPKFSVGLGIGVGSSNISFKKMNVDLKSTSVKLPFIAVDSTN
ncbi:MAG TPA: hypothetical protein VGP43_12540, partial [Chitinophagaceae bacterium]|nr:hypothetical protein [Chitinophagaceae bacterium]